MSLKPSRDGFYPIIRKFYKPRKYKQPIHHRLGNSEDRKSFRKNNVKFKVGKNL